MTDPMTNMEIEDVLSSIRRLVSENARGDSKPETAAAPGRVDDDRPDFEAPGDTARAPDAGGAAEANGAGHADADQTLVLTPALRVAQPVDAAAEHEADSEPQARDVDESDAPSGDAIADKEETLSFVHRDIEAESDESGAMSPVMQDAPLSGDAADREAVPEDAVAAAVQDALDEHAGAAAREATQDALQLDATFRHSDPETSDLEDRIAGLEAAVAAREDDWEPDGITESDNAAAPVDTMTWEDHDDTPVRDWNAVDADDVEEAELVTDAGDAPDAGEGHATAATDPAPASEMEAELAALAALTAMARKGEDVAADRTSRDTTPTAAEEGGDAIGLLGDGDTVLDEEMLRELVAEIVRQELQGSLGERITRNVRKLVRREIHRALTARDMD